MRDPCRCRRCGGTGLEPREPDPGELVEAIDAVIGDRLFTVRELFEAAAVLGGSLAREVIGLEHKAVGECLHSLAGRSLNGLRVRRLKTERGAAVWQVLRDLPGPSEHLGGDS